MRYAIYLGKEQFSLSKTEYISGFNNYLYQAGIEMLDLNADKSDL